MKVTDLGHDPNLGNQYLKDYGGCLIRLGKPLKTESRESRVYPWMDAQEQFDQEQLEAEEAKNDNEE